MRRTLQPRGGRATRGFTLVETMIALAIVSLLTATAIPVYRGITAKAQRAALAAEMAQLYSGFMRYNVDRGRFPADTGAGAFNVTTLSPLSTEGYFRDVESLERKLADRRMYFYWAPDWNGPESDFIVMARSAIDPDMYVYAMHYDFGGVVAYEGVYFLIDGQLVRSDGRY